MKSSADHLSAVIAVAEFEFFPLLGLDLPQDASLVAVVAAEALIVILLIVDWAAEGRSERRGPPTAFGYLGALGSLTMAGAALFNGQYVFASAQVVHTLVFIRIIVLLQRRAPVRREAEGPRFPVVAPDQAQSKAANGTRP